MLITIGTERVKISLWVCFLNLLLSYENIFFIKRKFIIKSIFYKLLQIICLLKTFVYSFC